MSLKNIKEMIAFLVAIAVFSGVVYGFYWVGKTVSYSFFYEDMVTRSIYEHVKPACIK